MFESCPSIPKQYVDVARGLLLKYHPMEYDPKIPEPEKRKIMEEWWIKTEENLK